MATPDTPSLPVARDARATDVLRFWIGDALQDPAALQRRQSFWFQRDPRTDAAIRERFLAPVLAASRGDLDHWGTQPADWLALLILLDQFPRNLFRGDSRAFASDPRARAEAGRGIAEGHDLLLPAALRLFCYLPFEHAEDPDAQRRSVDLFQSLAAQAPPGCERIFDGWLDYAHRHAEVIERFGRFPHRNAALGRPSTPAEQAWLATPGTGF